MSDDDVKAVVVYLRTLKPIHQSVPAKHIDFPVNLFIKFAPKPVDGVVKSPDPHDTVAYGKYMTRSADATSVIRRTTTKACASPRRHSQAAGR
ncbi:MAG TPA: hypothetical protein VLC46_24715 [Thermoanaerobaculia bacterium]|nr:hypothetical protein [Thermoanaerobaculia bacterium]